MKKIGLIAALVTITTALAGAGFWVGKTLKAAESAIKVSELNGKIIESQLQLKLAHRDLSSLIEANENLKMTHQSLQKIIDQKNSRIDTLSSRIGRQVNCVFIHKQILALEQQIKGTGSMVIFSVSKEWQQKQAQRKVRLEQRLKRFQKQLALCNN